jgi:hypothetical protein
MVNNKFIQKGLSIIEKLQFVAILIFSLFLIAGVDLMTADLGWGLITDPYFYISNVVSATALLLITFGTVYLVIDNSKATSELYIQSKEKIDSFAVSKKNIPSVLSKFLEQLNRKRKITQYEHNIIVKLYNLENKRKWYSYIPVVKWFVKNPFHYTEEEMHIWNYGTDEEKQKSAYCRKRKMYEEQLNPELIQKIIDVKYVKYDKITTATILNDTYSNSLNVQVNDFVTKNENGQIIKYKVPMLLLSFGFTFLLTSLVLDGFKINFMAFVTISAKLVTIVWNVFTSYRYAKKHFNNITLHDVLFRCSILEEYDKWLNEVIEKQEEKKGEINNEHKQID